MERQADPLECENMEIIDFKAMASMPREERETNVVYNAEEFKMRIIKIPADGKIPDCEMPSYVIFYVIEGSAVITVNHEEAGVDEGKCLVTEPATVSMKSASGARIIGIQIPVKDRA